MLSVYLPRGSIFAACKENYPPMNDVHPEIMPKAREDRLIIKELPDETLVYDLDTDEAHCLNSTAALVWKNCDGQQSIIDVTKAIRNTLNTAVDEEIVYLALNQLDQTSLLSTSPKLSNAFAGISRRQWVRRIGLAAIAIPMIISISAPDANAQVSCPAPPAKQPNGCPCNGNGNCLSGNCVVNVCQP